MTKEIENIMDTIKPMDSITTGMTKDEAVEIIMQSAFAFLTECEEYSEDNPDAPAEIVQNREEWAFMLQQAFDVLETNLIR